MRERDHPFAVGDRFDDTPLDEKREADRPAKVHLEIRARADAGEKRTSLFDDGIELAFAEEPQSTGLKGDQAQRFEPEFDDLRGIGNVRQQLANSPDRSQRFGGSPQRDPLGRAVVPARRLERFAGLVPVVRQQSRVLIEGVGVVGLEGLRDGRVGTLATLAELGSGSHLLGERVLERVLELGVEGALVEELGLHQRAQRLGELGRG